MSRRPFISALALIFALATVTGLAGTKVVSEKPTFFVELTDGSRISGTTTNKDLPLTTPYARLRLPMLSLADATASDDRETFTIKMTNGDLFKGVIEAEYLDLESLLGKLRIPIGNVKSISLRPAR